MVIQVAGTTVIDDSRNYSGGAVSSTDYHRIANPAGASYISTTATLTGALQVTLPVGYTNTMMRMTIKVYLYNPNESFDVICGGYNYAPSPSWVNTFAYILGNPSISRNFNVRFGFTASGKCCVYIGEIATAWSYPQFYVTDVQFGYTNMSSSWATGWATSIQSSAFENVTSTISSSQIGYATTTNTGGAVVLRDGSGNFSAGAITATSISSSGDITAFSGSDRRLKTNIIKIDNALDKVNKISGITYDWTEEALKSRKTEEELFGRRREAGVIAQEIEEVLPEVVIDRDDGYKAVRYEKLVPLLIEAIKELKAELDAIKEKIK